jgi:hypothetical protein
MKQGGQVQSEATFTWYLIRPVISSTVILLVGVVVSIYMPVIYDSIYGVSDGVWVELFCVDRSFLFYVQYIKTRKRLCPCRKAPSGDVPEYAPPVAGKKAEVPSLLSH